MNRLSAAVLCTALLTSCTAPGRSGQDRYARSLKPVANPSEVIATELAFARAAQDEGQWTAFAEYAADDAVMFVPALVEAKVWLKGRANPAQAVAWQPHQAWSSCDGSLALTKGAWQRPDGSTGYFTTLWQRQKDGKYRWIMDQGDTLEQPLSEPEMLSATVADCATKPSVVVMAQRPQGTNRGGFSADGTLYWNVWVGPGSNRAVSIIYWNGKSWQDAVQAEVTE